MPEASRDASKAHKAFKREVWPRLRPWLVSRHHIKDPRRLVTVPWGHELDTQHGVDYTFADIGLASRIQVGDWGTFTIRRSRDTGTKTEEEKLLGGECSARYHLQAYVRGWEGELNSLAVVRTSRLIKHIKEHGYDSENTAKANTSGEQGFGIIKWVSIKPDYVWTRDS